MEILTELTLNSSAVLSSETGFAERFRFRRGRVYQGSFFFLLVYAHSDMPEVGNPSEWSCEIHPDDSHALLRRCASLRQLCAEEFRELARDLLS